MPITHLDTALYRIELPVPLSDSTHGTMTHFELVTVRLRDSHGAEGVGWTYTTGAGGAAGRPTIVSSFSPLGTRAACSPPRVDALRHSFR